MCADNAVAKRLLGWEPKVDLATGLEKTYHWIKGQHDRRKRGESVLS